MVCGGCLPSLLTARFLPLILTVPPKIFPFYFGDEPMSYGDSVSVQCSVPSGDLPIGIRWYFNGEDINDPAVAITNIGKRSKALTIDSVTASHAGNYTCEASNKADIVHFSDQLIINGILINFPTAFGYPSSPSQNPPIQLRRRIDALRGICLGPV